MDGTVASARHGHMLSGVVGDSHWYRGNWKVLGELFAGAQYSPKTAYIVGITPIFRYTLATGPCWAPFIDGGFGPSLTDIGRPDLSTTFEFNIQGGVGVRYFLSDHQSITVQCRYSTCPMPASNNLMRG